jgi:hypothetical protein
MAQQTNGNDPVSATQEYHSKNFGVVLAKTGLTKREYFAAMAMQGMLSSIKQSYGKPNVNEQSIEQSFKDIQQFINDVADKSVTYSDALIEALNKEK